MYIFASFAIEHQPSQPQVVPLLPHIATLDSLSELYVLREFMLMLMDMLWAQIWGDGDVDSAGDGDGGATLPANLTPQPT